MGDNAEGTTLHSIFQSLLALTPAPTLLTGRAGDASWPDEGTWREYLLSLSVEATEACEYLGLHHAPQWATVDMPTTLRSLCDGVATASSLLGRNVHTSTCSECVKESGQTAGGGGSRGHGNWRQSREKGEQVGALLVAAVARLDCTRMRRVVDVGCGKGHLTSELSRSLGIPALGLDSEATVLSAARELYPQVTFERCDVVDEGLARHLCPGDLVVGLHPCGALGEAIVAAACSFSRPPAVQCACESARGSASVTAGSGCEEEGGKGAHDEGVALLMVPCCWHKQKVPLRAPLSAAAVTAGLYLPHAALKKASMALDSSQSLEARRARHQLRDLLRSRGVAEAEVMRSGGSGGGQEEW